LPLLKFQPSYLHFNSHLQRFHSTGPEVERHGVIYQY